MSLRTRLHAPASPGPPQPDTPASHYNDPLEDEGARVHRHARNESLGPTPTHRLSGRSLTANNANANGNGNGTGAAPGGQGQDSEPYDKLRKKNRFVPGQKVWMVIGAVVGIVLLTRLIAYRPQSPDLDISDLEPRDYINNSHIDPAPFEFCPVFGPGDAVAARRGQFELLRSRLHLGTGARVQRVLNKAMQGLPVTISVLGGSVSACHGAGDDPIGSNCYPARLYHWWNSVFPNPHNELTNGALKSTDSAYYAYCAAHHLPDTADIVILEFDGSDPNDKDWLVFFEQLVRSVLTRPEQPAVIILGHFSPQAQAQYGFAGPELLHNAVAQFYDLPHISAKGVLYDQYLENPLGALRDLYHDSQHVNHEGHDLMADVLISYFMSEICAAWGTHMGQTFAVSPRALLAEGGSGGKAAGAPVPLGGLGLRPNQIPGQKAEDGAVSGEMTSIAAVPRMRINDRPSNLDSFRETEPYCVSAADLVSPLPPSIFTGSGWRQHQPKNKDDRHYWYADQPGSRLRIPVKIGSGDVGIYYLQQPLGSSKHLAQIKCHVDDNTPGAKTLKGQAEVEEEIATLTIIDQGVAKGSHFVECVLDGELGGPATPFKILGIFTT